MTEVSIKAAIDDLTKALRPGEKHFRGEYWAVADKAFFWQNPPSGAGVIHLANGGVDFEYPTEEQSRLYRKIIVLCGCIDVLCALLSKIEYFTHAWRKGDISNDTWFRFVQSDIHAFHVELRSLFDTCAIVLTGLVPSMRDVDSFGTLRKKTSAFDRNPLPEDIRRLVLGCEWFDQLRTTRDFIMHNDRDAWILWRTDGHILFNFTYGEQIRDNGLDSNACLRHFLWENWVLLRPYAGYYFGRLVAFLNDFAYVCAHRANVDVEGFATWEPTLVAVPVSYVSEARGLLESVVTSPQRRFEANWDRAFKP